MAILNFFILVAIIVGALVIFLISIWKEGEPKREITQQQPQLARWKLAGVFRKKQYLFDSAAEYTLFKILVEIFGDRFHIIPQVNLSHLVETRTTEFFEKRANRSRMEKKSVDFVLCDKQRVVPQLVIELDGYTHNWESRKERDYFVNELMKDVGLPILRLNTHNLDRSFIKGEIERALAAK